MSLDRLNHHGDVLPILERACVAFGLGKLQSHELIEVGFEDYNVKLDTDKNTVVLKIFSKYRDETEIQRNVSILGALDNSDINHPKLHKKINGDIFYKDETGLGMVAMDYIDGTTFYSERSLPSKAQLDLIAREAVKINKLDIKPEFIFDKWAIPNIHWMYDKVKQYVSADMVFALEKAVRRYDAINTAKLTKCFVHGDIIKSNVIMSADGKPYIIDFSVANVYPRVQEVAVMAANLMADETTELSARVENCLRACMNAGGELDSYEQSVAYDYALAGVAMEYMGSIYERVYNDEDGEEVDYWKLLAENTLKGER